MNSEQLSTRQFEALRRWIAAGGQLVVSRRADYAYLATPRMRALLPAQPVGLRSIDAYQLHAQQTTHSTNQVSTADALLTAHLH